MQLRTMYIFGTVALILVTLLLSPFCAFYMVEPLETAAAEFCVGDVTLDSGVNMFDVTALYSHTAGLSMLSVSQLRYADIDANGSVNMYDTIALYDVVSGGVPPSEPPESSTGSTTTTTTTTTTTLAGTETTTTAPTTPTALLGIDVSYAQGTVDWSAVKESQVQFAILRCGYGQDEEGQDDAMWDVNAAACEELDIPYGAYFFCYARNAEEAKGEALHALRLLEGKSLTYPIFLDMEYSKWQGNLTPEQYAQIATVFCETVSAAGYKVGVYSNLDWWNNRLTDPCFDRWYRWVAQYNDTCDYQKTYHIWQYTDSGVVPGVTENTTDMNYCYTDFTAFV